MNGVSNGQAISLFSGSKATSNQFHMYNHSTVKPKLGSIPKQQVSTSVTLFHRTDQASLKEM